VDYVDMSGDDGLDSVRSSHTMSADDGYIRLYEVADDAYMTTRVLAAGKPGVPRILIAKPVPIFAEYARPRNRAAVKP
jgi:hypothetical protein